MVQLVAIINVFFVPLLPLYVIYRRKQEPLVPSLDLLFQYGIAAVCNIPLTKVFVFLVKKICGIYISIDSEYYTVAALISAIVMFFLLEYYKAYSDHIPWKEKMTYKGVKGVAKDLVPACILLFVSCFMLFVFEPILTYAANMDDFWFDFQIMIGSVLAMFIVFFLTGVVLIFAVYSADLFVSKRLLLYKGITLTGFIVFFLLYLQGNWLAGNLPVLEGGDIKWEIYGKFENFALVAALVIITVTIIILLKKCGLKRSVNFLAACSLVVFVMLFASLVPTIITNNALERKGTFSPTMKNFNTISSEKNFLIFLIDCVDSRVFYDVMMEDDDFRGLMEDFTYYPDTLCVFPYTRESIPNILTGTVYRNETSYLDYSSNAYNQSPLFEKLTQNDYEINLYGNNSLIQWGEKRNYIIENYYLVSDNSIDLISFMRQELKYVLFKYLPYGLKPLSNIETLDFDTCRISNSEYAVYSSSNKKIYNLITENSVLDEQSQNYFHYIHCMGGHPPYNLDKNLKSIKGGTKEQEVAACLTMIKAYLQRLKDNGVYDNSVIVIMSDHGNHSVEADNEHPLRELERYNAVLCIKGIDEKHEMLVSDRSVSFMELNDAFCDLIDGKQSTELFLELEPGRTRTVMWRQSRTRNHMVEYKTTGKAWETEKFIPTGNVYDLEE